MEVSWRAHFKSSGHSHMRAWKSLSILYIFQECLIYLISTVSFCNDCISVLSGISNIRVLLIVTLMLVVYCSPCTEHGQPKEVVRSLVPVWNNFVFFDVNAVSFHQVRAQLCTPPT